MPKAIKQSSNIVIIRSWSFSYGLKLHEKKIKTLKSEPWSPVLNEGWKWWGRVRTRIYFHFHPSIGNYFRSFSGKFRVWKLTIIWNNKALQIRFDNSEMGWVMTPITGNKWLKFSFSIYTAWNFMSISHWVS